MHQKLLREYDEIQLEDLAHSLRLWADLKTRLPKIDEKFSTDLSFKTRTPSKKIFQYAKSVEYIFCYLAGGALTYAFQDELEIAFVPNDKPLEKSSILSLGLAEGIGWKRLSKFIYIQRMDKERMIELQKIVQDSNLVNCDLIRYLDAEAARFQLLQDDGGLEKFSISREDLIRRIANRYGGSHPVSADGEPFHKPIDDQIEKLMKYVLMGVPFPYFILMKIAQDIIEQGARILGVVYPPYDLPVAV